MVSLSVIVASGGRASLAQTLASATPQLTVYDQLLLLVDQRAPYGHASRNLMMGWATGEYLAFLDDDEEWVEGAADLIRRVVAEQPQAAHIFETDGPPATGVVVVPAGLGIRWDDGPQGLAKFVHRVARRVPACNHPEVLVRHGIGSGRVGSLDRTA